MLKDYCGNEDIPRDAQLVQVLYKPTDAGKLAFVVESPQVKLGAQAIEVKVDLRRIYQVGGN
jgi:hypothetical protein